MNPQTKLEIERCQRYLDNPNPEDPDHVTGIEGAIRGLNDWFLQSVLEEIESGELSTISSWKNNQRHS